MDSLELREEIITTVCDFNESGLSVGTTGNLSVRFEKGFLITPTGSEYQTLESDDIVYCDLHGEAISGELTPSSEWPFHAAIYAKRDEINAVVHVHSDFATALSCSRKPIPAFHYMVALAGGDSIPCASYATFGSDELSNNIINELKERKACLLANHGMVTIGEDIKSAYKLAHTVEALARWYCLSLQTGKPILLEDKDMSAVIEKIESYGKQDQ